ncbi:DUF6916 family protein [Massilia endophytica]|uniref:DUF6916 family protein n=1 Tax=Massilia endophytica TaxID=2899220 RepID=UPI001E4362E1|nr:hypothetical protein [Massilia endophytica]UGQ48214.1 hypothetical protein LSQ66_07055 [Massilia endophytica]
MNPTPAFFLPLIGSTFSIDTQAGPVPLRLESCAEAPRRGLPEQFRAPLSLVFSGPAQPLLVQDNYYVDHPAMERQVWCIAPTPPKQADAQHYMVIFA